MAGTEYKLYNVYEMMKRCGRNRGRYELIKPETMNQENADFDDPDFVETISQ